MKKRYKMSSGKARKMFSRTADRTHRFNYQQRNPLVMRGGIRM